MIKKIITATIFLLALGTVVFFLNYKDYSNIQKPEVTIKNPKTPTPQPLVEPTLNKVTLDSIFNNKEDIGTLDKSKLTTLVVTGDFIPARSVNFQTLKYKNFLWEVEAVKNYFINSDIVFVDLEAPIFKSCPVTNEGFVFCGEEEHIQALKTINTTIVNLSNNHFHNYGADGIESSQKTLLNAGIKYTGANNLEIIEKNNIKFGFLGYNDIGYTPPQLSKAINENIISDINDAKNKCDVLVVTYHFGAEYNYFPDSRQKELSHLAIDNGADLVVGNHPHTIQPVEVYKDKIIMYAHGNFVFDQMWSEQTKQGVIGYYTFYKNNLVKVDYKPIYIEDYGKAGVPTEELSKSILNKLKEISYELETK